MTNFTRFKIYMATLGCLVGLEVFSQAKIVINETDGNSSVELKNIGDSPLDVSSYWLCDFPDYEQISNLTTTGSTTIAPGATLLVEGFSALSPDDSELGLYSSPSFGSSAAIVDYIEWGSSGHGRSSVAVAAGTWTTGNFIAAIPSGQTINYDGTGDASSDYFFDESTLMAKIVINETDGNGVVELKNIGGTPLDVSSYWLCNFPDYEQISDLTTTGSTTIAPGATLLIEGFSTLSPDDSELGLYSSPSFGSSSAIVDYIEWGSSGHGRSSVAVAAGTWAIGNFIAAIPSGQTINYDGRGDASSDYFFNGASLSTEDFVSGRTEFGLYPNLLAEQLLVYNADYAFGDYINIYDLSGKIVLSEQIKDAETKIDVTSIISGTYILEYVTSAGTSTVKKVIKK